MPYAGVPEDKYAFVLFSADWPEMTVAMNELAGRYRLHKRPDAALIIERAWSWADKEQRAMAREMAVIATKELRKLEQETRVRPDTLGGGGPRLGDYLEADIMPHQDLLPGAIGFPNEEYLDNNVPWWITNEIGSTTNIGRKLFGVFYGNDDSNSPPNMDEFREHPLFMPAPASGGGGMGIIEHGTPERRFIKKAIPVITRQWKTRFDAIKLRVLAEMDRAAVTMR